VQLGDHRTVVDAEGPAGAPQRAVDGHAPGRFRPTPHRPEVADDPLGAGAHATVAHGTGLSHGEQHPARAHGRQCAARQQRQQHPGSQAGDRQHRAHGHQQHARAPRDALGGVVRFRDCHYRPDHKQNQT
jgi:hypothetical protein